MRGGECGDEEGGRRTLWAIGVAIGAMIAVLGGGPAAIVCSDFAGNHPARLAYSSASGALVQIGPVGEGLAAQPLVVRRDPS